MTVAARPVRLEGIPAGTPIGYGGEWVADAPVAHRDPADRLRRWLDPALLARCSALVRGRRVPLVGRVSMDSVCADVTDAGDIGTTRRSCCWAPRATSASPSTSWRALRGTVTNEVFCAFGPRLERRLVAAPAGRTG